MNEFSFRFKMVNHTNRMADDDFNDQAEEGDIDWGEEANNDTDVLPTTLLPTTTPQQESNSSDASTIIRTTDVFSTDGFGLHFVGQAFGEEENVR